MGLSDTSLVEDFHLTGDGVAGCGGRVDGANKATVAAWTFGGRYGGMRK